MTLMSHCIHKQNDLKDVNIPPSRSHSKGAGLAPPSALAYLLVGSSWGKLLRGCHRFSRRSATESLDARELRLWCTMCFCQLICQKQISEEKNPKEPPAYFMPALLLINWGIETCAGNHNKENVTKAEILPWKNPHRCLEASTGDLHSGHMALMSPLDWCHSLQVTVLTEGSSHLVLKL